MRVPTVPGYLGLMTLNSRLLAETDARSAPEDWKKFSSDKTMRYGYEEVNVAVCT